MPGPVLRRGGALGAGRGGPANHAFIPPSAGGWAGVAVTEWELRGEVFADAHAHVELNYVLEGELHVTCDGVTVRGVVGDLIEVPAGRVGTYAAPGYARMLAVYGPNPDGVPGRVLGFAPYPHD
ncbi:cupin domain-containing protein [Actinocorallia herbida]|uniref:cupin domain-containing protein n=1 Tax=Actinocorallia herbida TaxID=58109 RepID=UPI001B868698|nr:cupin domain-containing protein [Actinocorallia herbida]